MPAKKPESLDDKMARIKRERSRRGPKRLKTPRTPEAVPPNTRKRVSETLTSGAREADRHEQKPSKMPRHLLEFKRLLKSNPDLKEAFHSVGMVCDLTVNSGKKRGEKSIEEMGFSAENLKKLMQALFCEAKDEFVTEREVKRYFQRVEGPILELIYKDMLRLNPTSTKDEQEQAASDFADKIEKHFPELLDYDGKGYVAGTLIQVEKMVERIRSVERVRPEDEKEHIKDKKGEIALEFNPESESIVFDEASSAERLAYYKAKADEEDEKPPSAPVVTPASEEKAGEPIDFEVFLRNEVAKSPEMQAAYVPLNKLYFAFSKPEAEYDKSNRENNFNGDDWSTMAGNIGEALDDGLAQALLEAAEGASEAKKDDPKGSAYKWALIKAVADHYKISDDPKALKSKLVQISDTLEKTYKNIGKRKKK